MTGVARRRPWAYLDEAGEIITIIRTEVNAREHFYAEEFFVGQLVPHPFAVDCVSIQDLDDDVWNRYCDRLEKNND